MIVLFCRTYLIRVAIQFSQSSVDTILRSELQYFLRQFNGYRNSRNYYSQNHFIYLIDALFSFPGHIPTLLPTFLAASNTLVSEYPSNASVFHSRFHLLNLVSQSTQSLSVPSSQLLSQAISTLSDFSAVIHSKAQQHLHNEQSTQQSPTVINHLDSLRASTLRRLCSFFLQVTPSTDQSPSENRGTALTNLWLVFNASETSSDASLSDILSIILRQYAPISSTQSPITALSTSLSNTKHAAAPTSSLQIPSTLLLLELTINESLCDFFGLHESLLVYRFRILHELLTSHPSDTSSSEPTQPTLTQAQTLDILYHELFWLIHHLTHRSYICSLLNTGHPQEITQDIRVFRALLRLAFILFSIYAKIAPG